MVRSPWYRVGSWVPAERRFVGKLGADHAEEAAGRMAVLRPVAETGSHRRLTAGERGEYADGWGTYHADRQLLLRLHSDRWSHLRPRCDHRWRPGPEAPKGRLQGLPGELRAHPPVISGGDPLGLPEAGDRNRGRWRATGAGRSQG